MSTTEINGIIEYLTKNGLTPEDIEDDGDFITCLYYDSFWIDIDCYDGEVIVVFTTQLDYNITFGKWCVNQINEFASDWEIHKGFIKITLNAKDKQDLVKTLKRCITMFVEG